MAFINSLNRHVAYVSRDSAFDSASVATLGILASKLIALSLNALDELTGYLDKDQGLKTIPESICQREKSRKASMEHGSLNLKGRLEDLLLAHQTLEDALKASGFIGLLSREKKIILHGLASLSQTISEAEAFLEGKAPIGYSQNMFKRDADKGDIAHSIASHFYPATLLLSARCTLKMSPADIGGLISGLHGNFVLEALEKVMEKSSSLGDAYGLRQNLSRLTFRMEAALRGRKIPFSVWSEFKRISSLKDPQTGILEVREKHAQLLEDISRYWESLGEIEDAADDAFVGDSHPIPNWVTHRLVAVFSQTNVHQLLRRFGTLAFGRHLQGLLSRTPQIFGNIPLSESITPFRLMVLGMALGVPSRGLPEGSQLRTVTSGLQQVVAVFLAGLVFINAAESFFALEDDGEDLFDTSAIGGAIPLLVIPALISSYTECLELISERFFNGDFESAASGTRTFVQGVYYLIQFLRYGLEFTIKSGLFILFPYLVQQFMGESDFYGTQEHPLNPGWGALAEFLMPLVFMMVIEHWDDVAGPFRSDGHEYTFPGEGEKQAVDWGQFNELRAEYASELPPLSQTSTERQVRAAYRKIAVKIHPDKAPGLESTFLDLGKLYENAMAFLQKNS